MSRGNAKARRRGTVPAILALCLMAALTFFCLGSCGVTSGDASAGDDDEAATVVEKKVEKEKPKATQEQNEAKPASEQEQAPASEVTFSYALVPAYAGEPSAIINDDAPFFTESDLKRVSFEEYAPLDSLGRCGVAFALIGAETMPTEERESIGDVKPTGWQTPISKYDFVDGQYLYNRCHLLAFRLAGENDNVQNLITGTRTMNTKGMKPFEDDVAAFVQSTGMHVLMRATPVFERDNLLASGVLLEAQSIEDGGQGLRLCRWCYNVEPGVVIDYATGANWAEAQVEEPVAEDETANAPQEAVHAYILNKNSKKFHYPDCRGVASMKEKNKQEFTGTRSEVISMGYDPCGMCLP